MLSLFRHAFFVLLSFPPVLTGCAACITFKYRRKMISGREIQLHSYIRDRNLGVLQQNLGGINLQIGNVSMGCNAHLLFKCLVETRGRQTAMIGNALQGGILCQVGMHIGQGCGDGCVSLRNFNSLCFGTSTFHTFAMFSDKIAYHKL